MIIRGDCLTELKKMPSESVDMVMTSPPYWALRKYYQGVTFKNNISEKEKQIIIKELESKGIKPKNI